MSGARHKCFKAADKTLRARNTKLAFAVELPGGALRLIVQTEKVDDKVRGAPVRICASFCPFCGEALTKDAKS